MCFHSREILRSKKRSCWNTTSTKCWSARGHQWLEMTGNFGTRLALMDGRALHCRGHKRSSNGTVRIGCCMVMSATIRLYQSRKQNCGFMEALGCSHELARWNKGFKIIYTFDNSTWGNA